MITVFICEFIAYKCEMEKKSSKNTHRLVELEYSATLVYRLRESDQLYLQLNSSVELG